MITLTSQKFVLNLGDALIFTCGSLRSVVRYWSFNSCAWLRVDDEPHVHPLAFGVPVSSQMYAIALRGVILPSEIVVDVTTPQSVEVCKAGVPTCEMLKAKGPQMVGLN